MSHAREISYTCPYCGKTFPITVYDTVNADQDTDLKEKAVAGDLFHHFCPHCHKDFMVQNDLLYMDAEHKFVIYLSRNETPQDIRAVGEVLQGRGFTLRRCAAVQEFTEKIQILEDGLDDAMVELAKYDTFIEFIDNRKGNAEDVESILYQNVNDGVMKINIRTGDKGMSFLIPVDAMNEEMKQTPEFAEVQKEIFPLVNADWIISLFTEAQGNA